MYKAENTDAQIFENINIYVSDPWNPSATGNISNLLVRTWDMEGKFYLQIFFYLCAKLSLLKSMIYKVYINKVSKQGTGYFCSHKGLLKN